MLQGNKAGQQHAHENAVAWKPREDDTHRDGLLLEHPYRLTKCNNQRAQPALYKQQHGGRCKWEGFQRKFVNEDHDDAAEAVAGTCQCHGYTPLLCCGIPLLWKGWWYLGCAVGECCEGCCRPLAHCGAFVADAAGAAEALCVCAWKSRGVLHV